MLKRTLRNRRDLIIRLPPKLARNIASHAGRAGGGHSSASGATTCRRLGTGPCAERSGCVLSQLFSASASKLDAFDHAKVYACSEGL